MPSKTSEIAWDFSPVFDLINSLPSEDVTGGENEPPKSAGRHKALLDKVAIEDQLKKGLGDFTDLWDYLGVERNVPPPTVSTFETATADHSLDKDAYASDGALYYPPSSKSVKWRDEEDGQDLTDFQPESPPDHNSGLTKTQRKKLNRKARKARETEVEAQAVKNKNKAKTIAKGSTGSGDESETILPPPARVAAVHKLESVESKATEITPSKPINIPSNSKSKEVQVAAKIAQSFENASQKSSSPMRNSSLLPSQVTPKRVERSSRISKTDNINVAPNLPPAPLPRTPDRPIPSAPAAALQSAPAQISRPSAITPSSHQHHISQTPTRRRNEIVPLAASPDERNWNLLLKLINNFPEDRSTLLSPLQLSINRPTPNGIHVFVDASNILIGFNDTLKRTRGLHPRAYAPRVNLNFHALALLLERRRPVAKRVLAGSTPEIPAYEHAREVGYETNILDKVLKVRERTDKQKFFDAQDRERVDRRRGPSRGSGYQSGSDSAGNGVLSAHGFATGALAAVENHVTPPQQAKLVEQGVDEVLHLKILESVIDTPIPSPPSASSPPTNNTTPAHITAPTMILATGDAAEAEYSEGFMKMVQRALGRGWNVEVAAWGQSVSHAYRRMEKSAMLGDRFRIIELDQYAEELFGEGIA